MPKVAVIRCTEYYSSGWDQELIVQSITDWAEVTDEELKILRQYIRRIDGNAMVLEQLPVARSSAPNILADCLDLCKHEKEEADKDRLVREQKRREAAKKKKAKQEETEKKQLEELLKKYKKETTT